MIFEVDITNVVSSWTWIPISKITKNGLKNLLKIEERLLKRIIGQNNTVVAISEAIRHDVWVYGTRIDQLSVSYFFGHQVLQKQKSQNF